MARQQQQQRANDVPHGRVVQAGHAGAPHISTKGARRLVRKRLPGLAALPMLLAAYVYAQQQLPAYTLATPGLPQTIVACA